MTDVWYLVEHDETGTPVEIAPDPEGIPIFLSRDVWENHILKHHPEMANFKDLILQALSSPAWREIEDAQKQFIRYYADIPDDRQPSARTKLQIRVVVKYVRPPERNNERTGLISSTYLVRRKVA